MGRKGNKWERAEGEEDLDKPETGQYHDEVNALFLAAIRTCLGDEYAIEVARVECNGMQFSSNWRLGGDFQSNLCMTVFRKHVVRLNKEGYKGGTAAIAAGDEGSGTGTDGAGAGAGAGTVNTTEPPGRHNKKSWDKFVWPVLSVTTVSELGLERDRIYTDPRELAQALIEALPEEGTERLLADAQVSGKQGRVTLTTRAHLEWHLIMGRLRCGLCGLFAKGARGLRMHQMESHGLEYEPAEAEAKAVSETQLIVFTASEARRERWGATAAAEAAARDAMDGGLECCRRGDLNGLRRAVVGGWDVHAARDRNGCTALNWAAGEGRLDVVRVLIEELNVDANALTGKPKRKRHSLHWAARNGHVEVSAYFIFKRGVSPDIPTEDGTTPLHYACMMSHLEMARWLVDEAHCDVNSLNSFGCNASQWCALAGCVPVMKLLRERGLDLYLLNRNGHSVLHKSAMKGMVAAVDFFIQPEEEGGLGLGLEYMQPDGDGFTPVSFARSNHFPELSETLRRYYDELCAQGGAEGRAVAEAAAREAFDSKVAASKLSQGRWTSDAEDFGEGDMADTDAQELF